MRMSKARRLPTATCKLLLLMVKQVVLYGAVGGVLIALLKFIEYKHFIREYPSEIYGGLVAVSSRHWASPCRPGFS